MARKEIDTNWDRDTRNDTNHNFEELYGLVKGYKDTLDALVLNSGESNSEVVQARGGHNTLNGRLDKTDSEISDLQRDIENTIDEHALDDLESKIYSETSRVSQDVDNLEEDFNTYKEENDFSGILLNKTKGEKIKSSTTAAVHWDKVMYNTDGFWSKSKSSRIVVPKGVTKVRVSGNVIWESDSSSYRNFIIQKNGSYTAGLPYTRIPAHGTSPMAGTSSVVEVEEGDYFEVIVRQSTGSDLELRADPHSWFALEVVESFKKKD